MSGRPSHPVPYAELHCHTNFSFLDGASASDELVDRAVELGLSGLAVTDHQGLYGAVRFSTAAHEAGLHPVIGLELELLDAFGPDPDRIVVPSRRSRRRGGRRGGEDPSIDGSVDEGVPARPRPERTRLPGHRDPVKEDLRGIGDGAARPAPGPAGPGPDRLSQPVPARQPRQPGRDEGRAAVHPGAPGRARRGAGRAVRLPRRRDRPAAAGRRSRGRASGGRGLRPAVRLGQRWRGRDRWPAAVAAAGGSVGGRRPGAGFRPRARAPPPARRRLARGRDRPPGRRARPAGRRHERRPLRPARGPRAPGRRDGDPPRPNARDAGRPPPAGRRVVPEVGGRALPAAAGDADRDRDDPRTARAWAEGIANAGELAAACSVDLGFEAYRFPGFAGARRRDAVLVPRRAVPRGGPAALPPDDPGRRPPARPRARRHRADRPGRVLPHLLGPDALRQVARDPGPGAGERGRLDRRLRPRDHPGRPDPPQPPVRAVHQRGPDDLSGRRHRLLVGAAGGGHPVRLRALRSRSTPGWSATS